MLVTSSTVVDGDAACVSTALAVFSLTVAVAAVAAADVAYDYHGCQHSGCLYCLQGMHYSLLQLRLAEEVQTWLATSLILLRSSEHVKLCKLCCKLHTNLQAVTMASSEAALPAAVSVCVCVLVWKSCDGC